VTAAVLQSAFRLLVTRGLQNLTVAEVAAASGVHETTIYRRWKTIASLALDACLDGISSAIPAPDCGSLHADLVALVRGIIDLLEGPSGRALLDICRITEPDIVKARASFLSARFSATDIIFDRAAKRGEWDPSLDRKVVIELLVAPIYLRALVTNEPLRDWPVDKVVNVISAASAVKPRPLRPTDEG
jgi:AcrR family transcriptional regulator